VAPFVLDIGDDPYVGLACFGNGSYGDAWVRSRFQTVRGRATAFRAALAGDCDLIDATLRKRRSNVFVRISLTAEPLRGTSSPRPVLLSENTGYRRLEATS
jgi:hypothetical protein